VFLTTSSLEPLSCSAISEMVEKQGELQDVLFGLAVAITEPEEKIHN
jgi:hypothetical protein